MTTEQQETFTQPRQDRDAELVAYDQLSRENRELRAALDEATESNAALSHQNRSLDSRWRHFRDLRRVALERGERAEAELADATTAAQNLRDELQGAQERLWRVRELADLWEREYPSTRPEVVRDLRAALDAEP